MIDWSQCPDVESHPDIVSGAYVVRGTRIPADAVIDDAQEGYSAEEIVREIFPTLPLERARRVIAFAMGAYASHPAE